jgi:cytochrome c oxidase cbb3-type subunit 3
MRFLVAAFSLTAAGLCAGVHPARAQHATPDDVLDGERAFAGSCANCHGPDGNLIAGIDLGRGLFRRDYSDEELVGIILNGIPDTPMPASPNMSQVQAERIVAYLRSRASAGRGEILAGDAARGRAIFFGKGACTDCHAVNARGARSGPDLSNIGLERRAAELEKSLLEPAAEVQPNNRSYRVTLADGEVVTGRLLNHDTFTVQLIDTDESLRSFKKAELRDYGFVGTSMPAYGEKLTQQEIADLVSYLTSLQGKGND